jgi:hypothetical protein
MAKKEKDSKLTFSWIILYLLIGFLLTTYVVLATWWLQAKDCLCS